MEKSESSIPPSGGVLSASYLKRHKHKKDLIRRLREIYEALIQIDEGVTPNSYDYPGLAGLAAVLVQDDYLEHGDKEVRLHTVLNCMQIMAVYAPEPPFDETEILSLFRQLIRQLANLGHCTSSNQVNYQHYFSLLQMLADFNIGSCLIEMYRSTEDEEILDTLADLFRTMLQSVRIEHAPEVADLAVKCISGCLEEFDHYTPIPLMDEVLVAVSAGPTVQVTNPAAVQAAAQKVPKNKMPPSHIQQRNPSYFCAAAVIRQSVGRISTPIANFINAILNGDPSTCERTNIVADEVVSDGHFSKSPQNDVWTIIYELHKISPQILTTVIGTVSHSLESVNLERRLRVTKLLGRLFYEPSSQIGTQYSPCFRQWIRRATDIDAKVRLAMAKLLIKVLEHKGTIPELAKEATDGLVRLMEHDPVLEVRLEAIHKVCDLAYEEKNKPNAVIAARLLQAVGSRVSSKTKTERRDALSGLAQIYFRYYIKDKVKPIESGGDDCEIDVILNVLRGDALAGGSAKKKKKHDTEDDVDEKYKWIPRKLFECACFTDATDPEMRNRVVQLVDEILLGNKKEPLSPTSKAVGLAMIMESLRDDDFHGPITSNSYKWMCSLFTQRASLQRALASYLDARTKAKATKQGTEEALAAEADAMEKLEIVASLTAPIPGSNPSKEDVQAVLDKVHKARDKHIFRILATISSPDHSVSARMRALDELPKRTKSLGDSTATWVKSLTRRCAMGHSLNAEVVNHCILLAQECFMEDQIHECAEFLSCVRTAVEIFPALGGAKQGFGTLMELFGECRSVSAGKKKKLLEEYDVVTTLSVILSAAAPSRMTGSGSDSDKSGGTIDSDLQAQLLKLCTRDGTPEQARHAVYTMAAMLNPSKDTSAGAKKPELLTWEKQNDAFGALLKSLTSPSRMTLATGSGEHGKLVSILTALAALAECAPALFNEDSGNKGGEKAIKFALETCLLGRRASASMDDADSEASDEEVNDDEPCEDTPDSTKSKRRKSRKSAGTPKHMTPDGRKSAVEDETLSLACRRLCASIEFIVSYIRHAGNSRKDGQKAPAAGAPSERVEQVFGILCQIVQDGGLPPASRDRRECRARQDRAALRKCAAIHLFQLCDGRLKLGTKYLTPPRWHVLAGSLLDDEKDVRESVMDELSMMLTGQGVYAYSPAGGPACAPHLRFVAMVSLCADSDHGSGHSGANGNAANVGKRSVAMKGKAEICISNLRNSFGVTRAQFRSRGKEAEAKFESHYKMILMPEYAVPYALHLLSFRRETPSAGGTTGSGLTQTESQAAEEEGMTFDEEMQHKMLRKRLKWLLEPLVQSLGDGADNISFLLRMVDLMGNHYKPKDVSVSPQEESSPLSANSLLSPQDILDFRTDPAAAARSAAKLKTICVAAREVLLSFVKKDVNLTPYPGSIVFPATLFSRRKESEMNAASQDSSSSMGSSFASARGPIQSERRSSGRMSGKKRAARSPRSSIESEGAVASLASESSPMRHSRVHFSPELEQRRSFPSGATPATSPGGRVEELSPIAKSDSPTAGSVSSEEKTLGTTPPSILRTTTATHDDVSPGNDTRMSLDSTSTARSTRSKRRAAARAKASPGDASTDVEGGLSPESTSTAGSKKRLAKNSRAKTTEANQSQGSMTTSETQSTDIFDIDSEPEPKKRSKTSKQKSKKKSASAPVEIVVKRKREDVDDDDEFAFSDEKAPSKKSKRSPDTENKKPSSRAKKQKMTSGGAKKQETTKSVRRSPRRT